MTTIALVDENRDNLAAVSRSLEAEGFRVQTYADSASAIGGLTADPPDLAILDIALQRLDGMELLRRLRQVSNPPDIVLTVMGGRIVEVRSLNMREPKPAARISAQQQLVDRVRAILRRQMATFSNWQAPAELSLLEGGGETDAEDQVRSLSQGFVVDGLSLEIWQRIAELASDARAANEPVSPASVSDLVTFLKQTPFTKRPAIFLLDNGNFRAVWKNADNEQAAFQFRGDGVVHCVFFYKRDSGRLPLSRETLVDLMPNLREKYSSFQRLLDGRAA